jgi:integrase/recombinase XerD
MARVGRPCKPRKPPSTPLQAMIEEYIESLAARGFAYNTYNVRRGHLYLFERWAMERGLSEPVEVTRPVLERFQRYLFHYRKKEGGPLSFSSQHSRLSSLRMWFRWMTRQNYLLHNPASEIELPRLSKSLPHVLTAAEAELILQQPNAADPLGIRDRAMLEMFYSTGMRRMELIRLRLYDVDRVSGIVTIREGKGRKDRVIPIGARAVAWLEKYLDQARHRLVAEPDEGTIFLTVQGEPFTPNRLSGLIGGYVEAAGTGKSGACHLFRHTMATLMLEGGADIRFIQQMLGHSRLDSTQIYTHVSIRMLKQIHSATHPAAQLKRGSEAPEEAVENTMLAQDVPGQMWPGVPASTAEQLFAALDAESAEEEQE